MSQAGSKLLKASDGLKIIGQSIMNPEDGVPDGVIMLMSPMAIIPLLVRIALDPNVFEHDADFWWWEADGTSIPIYEVDGGTRMNSATLAILRSTAFCMMAKYWIFYPVMWNHHGGRVVVSFLASGLRRLRQCLDCSKEEGFEGFEWRTA